MYSTEKTRAFQKILKDNKNGSPVGVFSICSANKYVLISGMNEALKRNSLILIESTCNQVNQFGGYTGMTPFDFRKYVESIASVVGFPMNRVILGGDHLGPYPWRNLPGAKAMQYSEQMVQDYAKAGYRKIHLDASMYCADDDLSKPLGKELSAKRAARLCQVIESTLSVEDETLKPVYVIGTEVPIPGGQQEIEENIKVTSVEDVDETIAIHRNEFHQAGLAAAWERVIAVVVQPGVEFNESEIINYDNRKTQLLKQYIQSVPGMVYEAHSTDYQSKENLSRMVEDHFAILKVGPALTFAYREALIGLVHIEELLADAEKITERSDLLHAIKQAMAENPAEWEKYLPNNEDLELAKIFSYSDRIRYYWGNPRVQVALEKLLNNLRGNSMPVPVVRQYFPLQYEHIREGQINNTPGDIIVDHIGEEIAKYSEACGL